MNSTLGRLSFSLLCAVVPSLAWARPADATAAETCKVLEAAYTVASGSKVPAYPTDVRPMSHPLELRKFVPEYKARMPLDRREFDDLASREDAYKVAEFQPRCVPAASPSPRKDDEGHDQFVSFTDPIFSTAGALALVEVSFREKVRFGYGMLCVVRRAKGGWTARCLQSWIT
jgi:hypothetical protein